MLPTGIPACPPTLRPPAQGSWPVQGMHHRRTRPPRLDQVRFQREIPLRRTVRIVDEHKPRIVLQPFRFLNHRLLVLAEKHFAEHAENRNRQKEQIPRRHEVDPAQIPPHRRHRRPAGKPHLSALIDLRAQVRQHKIDRRCHRLPGDFLQQLIGRAVRTRRMRAHAETVRNRLELLGFLVNAPALPPEPRLVHERPVCWVHQSDDPLIHMRWQLARKMRDLIFVAENGESRHRRNRLRQFRSRRIHVNPDVAVPLLAGIMPGKNPLHFQLILARKRRNLQALSRASIEPPSVIAALHHFPIQPPIRKRYPPVRARVPHRKHFPFGGSAKHQRHFQEHRRNKFLSGDLRAPHRRLPKIPQESRIRLRRTLLRRLSIHPHHRSYRFAHRRRRIVVYRFAPQQPRQGHNARSNGRLTVRLHSSTNGVIMLHSWRHREGHVATLNRLPAGIAWEKPADLSDKDVLKRLSPPAVKAFLKIRELWELRDEDARRVLGGMSNGAFYEWKRKVRAPLDQDRLTRISALTGIFKALNILYSKKLADRWIQLPNENPMFERETPLTYIVKGGLPAMLRVRQLLDSRRGGR